MGALPPFLNPTGCSRRIIMGRMSHEKNLLKQPFKEVSEGFCVFRGSAAKRHVLIFVVAD